jgi:hypothetical protein
MFRTQTYHAKEHRLVLTFIYTVHNLTAVSKYTNSMEMPSNHALFHNVPNTTNSMKLTVAQLVKKFPAFYGKKSSLPCSQEPATGPFPDPDEFNPPLTPCSVRSINIFSHLRQGLPCVFYHSSFSTKMYAFHHARYMPLLISSHLISSHLISSHLISSHLSLFYHGSIIW